VMRREGGREDAKLPWQKAWKRRRSLIARRSSSLDSGNPPEKAGDLFYACVKKRGREEKREERSGVRGISAAFVARVDPFVRAGRDARCARPSASGARDFN